MEEHYHPHRQPSSGLHPIRPLPTPSNPTSSSSSSSIPSQSTWPTTPSSGQGEGRRPSATSQQLNTFGSGSTRAHGKDGSSSSNLSSPNSTQPPAPPPRSHSPLPPLPSHQSRSSRAPLPPNAICTATADHEVLSVVKLAGLTSPAGIKERILTKLQIGDDEFFKYSFYKSRIGGNEDENEKVDDEGLWEFVREMKGGMLVFVKQELNAGGTGAVARKVDEDGWDEADISAAIAQSMKYATAAQLQEVSPTTLRSSGQERAPSISSRSDREAGEFGERGNGYSNSSWPRAGEGHRANGSHSSAGGGGGSQLSPPERERGRDRAGSLTPTAPDDFRGQQQGGRRQSEGDWGEMTRRPSANGNGGRDVIMIPSGPVRPLPGPPPQQHQQHEPRQRTQTAPGVWVPPQPPNPPPQNYRPVPILNQPIRPLPATQPPPQRTQFQYAPLPSQGMAPYNMSIQIQYQTPNTHAHALQAPPRHPSTMSTKSTGNLREVYHQAFDSEMRPTPPPPPPTQATNGTAVYRAASVGMGHPGAMGSRPPLPPALANYPQSAPIQQRPTFSPIQSYPSPNQSHPPIFDPRTMRPENSGRYTPAPPQVPPYPSMAKQPPPPQRPYTAGSGPPTNWPNTNPQRRPTNDRFPDFSGHIPLQPGQTLQQAARPQRRPSEMESTPTAHGRGPVAAHMMAADPSLREGVETDRYGRESTGSRRESSNSGGDRRSSAGGREGLPKSLQAGPGGSGGATATSPRDSGSSFHSSASSRKASVPPPLAPSAPSDDDPYGGMDGDNTLYQSPPSSARSSTSAVGPSTPANDANQPIPTIQTPPTHPVLEGTFENFGEEEEGGTWVGNKGPPKPPPVARSPQMVRQRSAPTPSHQAQETSLDSETGTARANEWAQKIMERFSGPEAETLRPSSGVSPQNVKAADTFSSDDFADDVEGETFFAGHGPRPVLPPLASPPARSPVSPPVGVSLTDEPASRSPTNDRRRPPLRIETLATGGSSNSETPASNSNSSPNAIEASPLGKQSRRSAGGDSDTSSSAATSSRRENRAPRSTRLGDVVTLSSPPLGRSPSLADRAQAKDDWAFRPPVETVLEHLEVFFPEHASELDKPVFDAPTPPVSTPSANSSPAQDVAPPPVTRPGGATGLGYKKSIRIVARDRKRNMLKASTRDARTLQAGTNSSLLRRKSTKLFGSRLEEVTSAQIKQMDTTIPEAVDDDPDNFSFKWIKGDLIGRGTYGKVYIAFNVTAGEAIAVKQVELPKTRSDREDIRQQGMVSALKGEIELLKDLEHPNIVEYLGMEETVEHLSIFLEYVPGGSVGRILKTHGKFEEDIIRSFTFQVLSGLEYLHRKHILHRDLKADNILCDHEGTCKISDFGTSKRSADIYNNDADMSMQGTIFWMAPEVIHNEHKGYSAKADIWSVGCLCLEMLAGRRPWSQEQAIAAMFKIGAERRPPPVPADVHLSKDAEHFLGDCLKIEPDERPKAKQLMRHRFLELPTDWSFLNTTLYRAISTSRNLKRHN